MTPRVVMIDHRDSFVFILGDQFARAGADVITVRSDVTLDEFQPWLQQQAPDLVVLSPGPGTPLDTGVTLPWLATDPKYCILGICLGHQALAHAAGGTVQRAPAPFHARASRVELAADQEPHRLAVTLQANPLARAFAATATLGMDAARYHSLLVTNPGKDTTVLATTCAPEAAVMALAHNRRPRLGLQFHPESILTPQGGPLITRLLEAAAAPNHRNPQLDSNR